MEAKEFAGSDENAWCPGCGNFGIMNAVKKALAEIDRRPADILLVSGIGQAAKLPHYIKANCFNGLHGRALPVASGAKIANRELTVIVTTGDGDCYGEGGNHLIHGIRRNIDITVVVHNNQIYGLTKGQASPTTDPGFKTKVQADGVILEPFHALEFAIALGCGFVARGFTKEIRQLAELITEGINFPGFALIEVLQPCVSFNSKNTYDWYGERVYNVNAEGRHDPWDKVLAYEYAGEWGDTIPTGIIYRANKPDFIRKTGLDRKPPLVDSDITDIDLDDVLKEYL